MREVRSRLRCTLAEIEGQNVAFARCLMTDLQVGASASDGREWRTIHSILDAYVPVEVDARDFHAALVLQEALAEAGLKGRKPPDLLIAAAAIRLGLIVLHYDRDFQHIATVSELQHEWIVQAGSVD